MLPRGGANLLVLAATNANMAELAICCRLSHDGVDTPGRPQLEERRILRREGGRAARQSASQRSTRQAVGPGVLGGTYRPLSDRDLQLIHATVLDVLEKIGMGDPPAEVQTLALSKGCRLNERGRLCFPRALVEDVIAKAGRNFTLHARDPAWSLDLRDARVHFGLGEAKTIRRVEVLWPSGTLQVLNGMAAGRVVEIVEPVAAVRAAK